MRYRHIYLMSILALAHNYQCTSEKQENRKFNMFSEPDNCTKQLTRVATQKNLPHDLTTTDKFISETTATYLDVIAQPLFVDKSYLIELIFKYGDHKNIALKALIIYPPKWGKSTNLKMIKFFAEMIISKNGTIIDPTQTAAYKFFKHGQYRNKTCSFEAIFGKSEENYFSLSEPPLISKSPTIIDKHLAQYLTIHISLILTIEDGNKLNYPTFLRSFQKMIIFFFDARPYIKKKLVALTNKGDEFAADLLKRYNKMCDTVNTLNENVERELRYSLVSACQCLEHCYQDHQTLILIDDYDYIYNEIYFNSQNDYRSSDAKSIVEFIDKLMVSTFELPIKNGRGRDISVKSIITGISWPSQSIFTKAFSNFSLMFGIGSLQPFYGFVTEEVEELVKLRGLPSDFFHNLISSYDGYRSIYNLTEPIFNPVSVIKHLNRGKMYENSTNQELDHWISTGNKLLDQLPFVFTHLQIRFKIEPLLNLYSKIEINVHHLKPSTETIEKIAEMVRNQNHNNNLLTIDKIDAVFGVLLSAGYLGFCDKKPHKVYGRIPNEELRLYFNGEFNDFYSRYQHNGLIKTTANDFLEFLENNETLDKFESSIRTLFQKTGPYSEFIDTLSNIDNGSDASSIIMGFLNRNEASAHFTIFQVLSFLQREKKIMLGSEVSFSNDSVLSTEFKYQMDLVCCNKNNFMIIQMKADKNIDIETIFQQAKDYLLVFKNRPAKHFVSYKLVAINVKDYDCVDIRTETMTEEDAHAYRNQWDVLEEESACRCEKKEEGFREDTWEKLPVKEMKEYIDDVRKEMNQLRITLKTSDFLNALPKSLQRNPHGWNNTDVKLFFHHCQNFLNRTLNFDQKDAVKHIDGKMLCGFPENYFLTDLVNPESARDVYNAFTWVKYKYWPNKKTVMKALGPQRFSLH